MADCLEISRPPSRLSESWDDIVYEKRHDDDQQSENSTARSLIRKNHEEGDIESLDGGDTASDVADDESAGCSVADQDSSPYIHGAAMSGSGQGQGSSMTAKPTYSQVITFQEVSSSKTDVELKCVLNIIHESDLPNFTPALPANCGQLFGSVNMTTSTEALDIDRPLRLLYVGNSDQRSAILAKFGDALMAGKNTYMEESRYHVLPTSADLHGPTELVPIQAQIVVDECITAASVKDSQLLHEQIYLRFKKGQQCLYCSTWTGKGEAYQISPSTEWSAPDLAVLCFPSKHAHSEISREYEVMQERLRLSYKFLSRHGVPVMMMSEDTIATLPISFPAHDKHSLRFCIESSTHGSLRSFPLDLEAFENLDSLQLNAHLAYLMQRREVHGSKISSLTANASMLVPKYVRDIEKNLSKSFYLRDQQVRDFIEQRSLQVSAILIFTLLTSVFAYALFWIMSPNALAGNFNISKTEALTIPASIIPSTKVDAIEISLQPSHVTVAVGTQAVTSLSTVSTDMDSVKSAIEAFSGKPTEHERFEVQRIADGSLLLLKMPPSLIKKGRIPTFHVQVKRAGLNVDFQLQRMFDNIFTVSYRQDEMFGKLAINITVDRPYQTEIHDIDYGNSWLNANGWKHSAKKVAGRVGNSLMSLEEVILDVLDKHVGPIDAVSLERSIERATQQIEYVHKKAMESFLSKSTQLKAASNAHAASRRARASIVTYTQTTSEFAMAYALDAWAALESNAKKAANSIGLRKEHAFKATPKYLAVAQKRAQQIKHEAREAYLKKKAKADAVKEAAGNKLRGCMNQQVKRSGRVQLA